MNIVTLIVEGLLGLAFLASGFPKVLRTRQFQENFKQYRYPAWFLPLVGGIEVLAAIALVVGFWVPVLAVLGGFVLVVTMAGAVWTHLVRVKDAAAKTMPAAILLILALFVTVMTGPALTHLIGL
jgi:putative oxidoreductase